MDINLEELARIVRGIIETETRIDRNSFGCGVKGDRLMVKLLSHHIKQEVELPVGVTKQVTNQVVNLFSKDHTVLADTAIAMLKKQ